MASHRFSAGLAFTPLFRCVAFTPLFRCVALPSGSASACHATYPEFGCPPPTAHRPAQWRRPRACIPRREAAANGTRLGRRGFFTRATRPASSGTRSALGLPLRAGFDAAARLYDSWPPRGCEHRCCLFSGHPTHGAVHVRDRSCNRRHVIFCHPAMWSVID
eukprot:SAG11_NODE_56_length_19295_cov_20.219675_6_plen_162_part_00